jgi:hypothetical protein
MSKIMELVQAYVQEVKDFGYCDTSKPRDALQTEVTRMETELARLTELARCQHVELYDARLKLAALEGRSTSGSFVRRTNEEYAAWCKTYYIPEALDSRGMKSLDGLHAWQARDRRCLAAGAKERT